MMSKYFRNKAELPNYDSLEHIDAFSLWRFNPEKKSMTLVDDDEFYEIDSRYYPDEDSFMACFQPVSKEEAKFIDEQLP